MPVRELVTFVESELDIIKNSETINQSLNSSVTSHRTKELIKNGMCFYVMLKDNIYYFYPSKFIGYKNNSIGRHYEIKDVLFDGRETNKLLINILKSKPVFDSNLEEEYIKYCRRLGIVPNAKAPFGKIRKYWKPREVK